MYYHNHIADFEALANTQDNTNPVEAIDEVLAILASLALALITIAIVFN
jgi:hypothetical protein